MKIQAASPADAEIAVQCIVSAFEDDPITWEELEAGVPGMSGRTAVYEQVSSLGAPDGPHYHLGVIAVAPHHQGGTIGRALLQAFCALSASDPASCGVYLETATQTNLNFYEKAGFTQNHQGAMGTETLWRLFLPQARDPA